MQCRVLFDWRRRAAEMTRRLVRRVLCSEVLETTYNAFLTVVFINTNMKYQAASCVLSFITQQTWQHVIALVV